MNDNAIHKALELKGIDLEKCHFNFSQVNSPTGVPHNEEEFNKVIWMDHNASPVTWEEVKSASDMLDAEFEAQAYARARQPLYPDIGDQLDDLYHKGAFSTEMANKIKKVKDDNPKPK